MLFFLIALAQPVEAAPADPATCTALTAAIADYDAAFAEAEPDFAATSLVDCATRNIQLKSRSDLTGEAAEEFVRIVQADPKSECETFQPIMSLADRGWRWQSVTLFADGLINSHVLDCPPVNQPAEEQAR